MHALIIVLRSGSELSPVNALTLCPAASGATRSCFRILYAGYGGSTPPHNPGVAGKLIGVDRMQDAVPGHGPGEVVVRQVERLQRR